MCATEISAERVISCARPLVWYLIADPARHHLFGASGMVSSLATAAPHAVGDVFRMNMTYTDENTVEHYQSDNYVT